VILDYSGVPEAMETLISLLGMGGKLICIGAIFPQRALQKMRKNLFAICIR